LVKCKPICEIDQYSPASFPFFVSLKCRRAVLNRRAGYASIAGIAPSTDGGLVFCGLV